MSAEQAMSGTSDAAVGKSAKHLTTLARGEKRRKSKGARKRDMAFYLMLLPGVLILLINNYIPMIGVLIPFENYRFNGDFFSSLFHSEFVGFKNFEFMFRSPDCITATVNTVLYNLVFIALDVLIPITLAVCMAEMWNQKKANTYQTLLFLPFFVSWVAVSYVVYAYFCNSGFINKSVFQLLGVNSVDFYTKPEYWPAIIMFFHLWHYTGYNMIIYIASIAGINNEYYEAAVIDGATKWQQVRYITLPMLKTTAVILSLLAASRIFNGDFDLFYNVPKNVSQLYSTTSILDTFVYNQLMNIADVGMSAAAGLYQAVVGCVVIFIINLIVRRVDPDSALF